MSKPMPSQEELKAILRYEPETGRFYWLGRRGRNGVKPGDLAGTSLADGRRHINIGNKPYLAYRLAWVYMTGSPPSGVIDHIDGNPSNDRWENLRDVPCRVNSQNKRKATARNTSGLLGVCKSRKKWSAAIRTATANHVLGVFETPEAAHQAYLAAKRELHEGCTI